MNCVLHSAQNKVDAQRKNYPGLEVEQAGGISGTPDHHPTSGVLEGR